MSDENNPDVSPENEECPAEESFGFGDDLELNQFDGLPFSSRYYKLLKERKTLPVWKVRCEFEDALVDNQLVIVSGTAKTGRSTQVRDWIWKINNVHFLLGKKERCLRLKKRSH